MAEQLQVGGVWSACSLPWLSEHRCCTPWRAPYVRGVWCWGQAIVSWISPAHVWQQWHCRSCCQSTACPLGSKKWPLHQVWCRWHPLESLAIDGPSLAVTSGVVYLPVAQWYCCTSCGPTACNTSTRWRCCQHHCNKEHRDTCQISWGHQGQTYDQEHGLLHVNVKPFTFHTSLPCLALRLALISSES